MNTIIFDIETGPLPDAQLASMKPEFVANRTLKDPEKIKADLAAKETAWREGAALDALTGQVVVIGTMDANGYGNFYEGHEPELLSEFWAWIDERFLRAGEYQFVGFNIFGFDLPFLIRRSWACGVRVPKWVRSTGKRWSESFIDLMDVWRMGVRDDMASLDAVGRHLGMAPKEGNGKDFAGLYAVNRPVALAYLERDLRRTKHLADKMLA